MSGGTLVQATPGEAEKAMALIMDAIRAVQTGEAPLCGPMADIPHIQAVRMVQSHPIRPVRPELIETVKTDSDSFFLVKDLESLLARCAGQKALPSELGISLA